MLQRKAYDSVAGIMRLLLPIFVAAFFGVGCAPLGSPPPPSPSEAVLRDVCNRRVVVLGERAEHGDHTAVKFKSELVRSLVERCGFDALFFEASHFDFLAAEKARQGRTLTAEMISSSVGGLWSGDDAFKALTPFLLEKANANALLLGGLNDYLGVAGAFYSNDRMPAELIALLPVERRQACLELLKQRIYYNYSRDKPYSFDIRSRLNACLDEMGYGAGDDERRQMIANIRRLLARDFDVPAVQRHAREASLYANFEWLARRLPPRSKIIVWTATVHGAKDASARSNAPTRDTLGALLRRRYRADVYTLGFSGLSGAYGDLPSGYRKQGTTFAAARGSIEHFAFLDARADAEAVYLNESDLRKRGVVPGFVFGESAKLANWADVVDGLVVFRKSEAIVLN